MLGILARTLIIALGLWLASTIVPGIDIVGAYTLVFAALLLGFINAFVRPIIVLFTLPITIVTLGLFLLVINAAMLGLVAALLDGFHITGFFSAIFGAVIISLTSALASWFVGPDGKYQVIVIERRR